MSKAQKCLKNTQKAMQKKTKTMQFNKYQRVIKLWFTVRIPCPCTGPPVISVPSKILASANLPQYESH